MSEIIINLSGWIGTILIVSAYYLISVNKIDSSKGAYQIINLVGAVLLGINVFYRQAWPAFTLEVIWGAIAILALIRNKQS